MKPKALVITSILSFTALTSWGVIFSSAQTPSDIDKIRGDVAKSNISEAAHIQRIERMEKEQARILKRLQLAAPMEVELENGVDPINIALEKGLIVEVSLEQVEAALKQAASTPGTDDDDRANRLAHFGSYRFFAPE